MTGFTYKSYNFVDKDPIIDEVRAIYEASGANYKWIEERSGVTTATMHGWWGGKTRKPQAATINAVLRVLGYKLGPVAISAPVVIMPAMEQPKPRPEPSARHVVQMHKYRKRKV
jgi:hypothetical protein